MTLPGSNDLEKLHALCDKTYKDQSIWFLNAFWETFAEKESEKIWEYVLKCSEIDIENHEEGSSLDEMKAHVFLEKFDETLTVRELRAKLRSTGAIGESERPKRVPLTHYLLFKYNCDWHVLVNAAQGDNSKEIAKAQAMLDEVSVAFEECKRTAAAASQALREAEAAASKAKQREEESHRAAEQAKQREADSKKAEAEAKAAQVELEAALEEVHAQERAYNDKKEALEKKSQEGGVVSRNKAANELAQLLAEDPLPLRRAKITAEAAVKRAEKTANAAASARQSAEESSAAASKARQQAEQAANQAEQSRKQAEADAAAATSAREAAQQARKAAEDARAAATKARQEAEQARAEATAARQAAEQARAEATAAREEANKQRAAAEQARQASEQAKEAAEKALNDASDKLKEAEAYVEEVRNKPGVSFGQIWWIDRELHEQKKYLPVSKGGIAK